MAKQETTEVKRRAYVSGFNLRLNVMSATGDLFSRTKPEDKAVKSSLACPVHAEAGAAVRARQAYHCIIDDDHEFTVAEAARARDDDKGVFTLIDGEARQAAKEASDLPDKVLDLTVHAADEIAPWLAQSGRSYLFEPKGEADILMVVLLELLNEDGTIDTPDGPVYLVGQTLIRKEERMVVLGKWNGRITINEVERPENLIPLDAMSFASPGDKMIDTARTLIATSVEPFSPDDYADAQKKRVIEAMDSGEAPAPKKRKTEQSTDDLIALLQASIAEKQK